MRLPAGDARGIIIRPGATSADGRSFSGTGSRGRRFADRNVRRLPHQLGLRNAHAVGEFGDAHDFGLIEHGEALGAVAVGPFHVVVFAARRFHEVFQERLVVGG